MRASHRAHDATSRLAAEEMAASRFGPGTEDAIRFVDGFAKELRDYRARTLHVYDVNAEYAVFVIEHPAGDATRFTYLQVHPGDCAADTLAEAEAGLHEWLGNQLGFETAEAGLHG